MDPDDKQQITELLQKHIDGGDTIDSAKQKLLDAGYDNDAAENVSTNYVKTNALYKQQLDPGNIALAENEVDDITSSTTRKRFVGRGFLIGAILSGILDFYPWFSVNCHSTFYRGLGFDEPMSCSNLRVTGVPFPIRGVVTFSQLQSNGQFTHATAHQGSILYPPFGLNMLCFALPGMFTGWIIYRYINRASR
jgi:hypothetical protein